MLSGVWSDKADFFEHFPTQWWFEWGLLWRTVGWGALIATGSRREQVDGLIYTTMGLIWRVSCLEQDAHSRPLGGIFGL